MLVSDGYQVQHGSHDSQSCGKDIRHGEAVSLDDYLEYALAAYDAERLPAEAVTCLALSLIDQKDVQPRVQKAYSQDFHERYEAVRRAFGLGKDEYWPLGEEPAEWQALDAEFERTEGRIRAEALTLLAEKMGHPLLKEIAALGRSDSLALEKRREEGRQWLFGPPDPAWAACLRARRRRFAARGLAGFAPKTV